MGSWQRLEAYRSGYKPPPSTSPSTPISTRPTPQQEALLRHLPNPGVHALALGGQISTEIVDSFVSISRIAAKLDRPVDEPTRPAIVELVRAYHRLHEIGTTIQLQPFEEELRLVLMAICIIKCSLYGQGAKTMALLSGTVAPGKVMEDIADLFILLKLAGAQNSELHRECLSWVAVGIASGCFLQLEGATPELRIKGHIIHFSIMETLLPESRRGKDLARASWATMEEHFTRRCWWTEGLDDLQPLVHTAYSQSVTRQRKLEDLGLFSLAPNPEARVEYMVHRSYRGKLSRSVAGNECGDGAVLDDDWLTVYCRSVAYHSTHDY
jgi:hypothetical protein